MVTLETVLGVLEARDRMGTEDPLHFSVHPGGS